MCCLIFHKYVSVVDIDHTVCGKCFRTPDRMSAELALRYPKGYCPHSFKVCKRCGKAVGYGSHGKLTLIPTNCKDQIESMTKEPFKKED